MNLPFASLSHQRLCATLLAYTAKTFLPILQPIQGAACASGFYYDFLAETKVDELVLVLLTEELRRNIRKEFLIESVTMVPKNAADFLQKAQSVQAALLLESEQSTVELLKINNFFDIAEIQVLFSTKELQDFTLLQVEHKEAFYEGLGECEIVRIHGVVCSDKKTLKGYVKEYEEALLQDPEKIAKKKALVEVVSGYPIWYPAGLDFFNRVKESWTALCIKQSIAILSTPSYATKASHELVLRQMLKENKAQCARTAEWVKTEPTLLPQECEGLFQTKEHFQDRVFRLVAHKELERELIYSLQFMQELLSIFEIDTTVALVFSKAKKMQPIQDVMEACSRRFTPVIEKTTVKNARPRLEFRTLDARKREWLMGFVEVEVASFDDSHFLIEQLSVFSLERLLGIYLGGYKKA